MKEISTVTRTVAVRSPAMPTLLGVPALEFKRLQGQESLGNLFSYNIELQTPDNSLLTEVVTANLPVKVLVGKEFSVSIEIDDGGIREINGLVTRARFVRAENRRSIYEVVIEPWLTLATRTSDFKIFQNKTPLEIIQEVLADYSFPTEVRVSHTYPNRVFQVQYGETDFAFISRLMEEWGIYYFFAHDGGVHRLVLVDDAGAHTPFHWVAYQVVNFYGEGAKLDEEYCYRFDVADTLAPGQWVIDDFDFTQPNATLRQISRMPRDTGNNKQEMYQWPGGYADPAEGERLARIRMQEAGSLGKRASGEGNLRAMVPGFTFSLHNHPQETSNRDWLIIGASLLLHESSHAAEGDDRYECHTEFQVQPANDTYRSPQRHPVPRTAGPQTAVVTGPPGKEIWTNEYGQVKVSFHWNRYCSKDENSSCWVRVSSPSAGNGFGGVSIPRIGQEVVVDFENGLPHLPMITGRVFNKMNMPPWSLPDNMTQSGLLSCSTPDGSPSNAMRFEDQKGQEELWTYAKKDERNEIVNDQDRWVGNDRRTTIDRDDRKEIKRDEIKNVRNNRNVTVDKDQITKVGQNRSVIVDHDETKEVRKNRSVTVDGDQTRRVKRNSSETVDQDRSRTVQGTESITVRGAASGTFGQNYAVNVGQSYAMDVGQSYAMDVGQDAAFTITGNASTTVYKNQTITVLGNWSCSSNTIRLISGRTSIVVSPGLIEINADTIRINGRNLTEVNTGQFDVNPPR